MTRDVADAGFAPVALHCGTVHHRAQMGPDIAASSRFSAQIEPLVARLVEVRRDLHMHPELGFAEHRTQALVEAWLAAHGYATRRVAGTGVVADLKPDATGRTIGLRADLDCLPMPETTDLPWRSVHDGCAHKCGHDGHTAVLLGVAAVLAEHRERIAGNVRLLFQPAEEGVRGGGAKVMVAEGALAGVDEVYGLHNWPPMPQGTLAVRAGPMMAQTFTLEIVVRGVGGHGSEPQRCRDPIVAASHLVVALQTAVSRGLGHKGGAAVSIGRFSAGTTDNVIPERAELSGTVRTFSDEAAERVVSRIREIATGTAATFGVQIDLHVVEGYPVLVNDPTCADAVARVGRALLGDAAVGEHDLPIAGGEDFAYFTRAVPGAYFLLGAGEPGGGSPACHHPDFDFNDALIPSAMAMLLGLVDDRLPR
jgi:amidohydrolase